jgi:hypothetical protein
MLDQGPPAIRCAIRGAVSAAHDQRHRASSRPQSRAITSRKAGLTPITSASWVIA